MSERNDTITLKAAIPASEAVKLQRALDEGRDVKLTGTLVLPEKAGDTLNEILTAESDDMVELLKIAGLDPSKDLTYQRFEDVDWKEADLAGYNFDGASLRGSDFSRAKIDGMSYVGADIEDVVWPEGYEPDNGAAK